MSKFMKIYSKLFDEKNNKTFIDIMENTINSLETHKNKKYIRNLKYTTRDYICGIIEVLSNNISWRKYNGLIDGRILNNKHNYYAKLGVYEKLYETLLKEYVQSNNAAPKYFSIDSTFIPNKYGTENISRNVFYKNKNGMKITTIVDNKGAPLPINFA